jgi:Na+-transporting methylmalonyl-CoA/oxaloacetate decarboxylase beta subunit
MGVVAASALAYPLLVCAVELVFAQLLIPDAAAVVGWLALGLLCSVAFVGALRWGAARRVLSPWLLLGLAPPVLYEVWLTWPLLTA